MCIDRALICINPSILYAKSNIQLFCNSFINNKRRWHRCRRLGIIKMKKLILAAAFLGCMGSAHAQLINAGTAIPDANILINLNNTGLDWVYAGPIAPNEFSAGNLQPANYRAAEGWRVATTEEWALRPEWTDFIVPGYTVSPGYTNDHNSYIFASEYWGPFSHVDLNDYAAGRVTDGVNGYLGALPETIYVRDTLAAAVPEPETYAMLMAGLGLIGFVSRRRRQA